LLNFGKPGGKGVSCQNKKSWGPGSGREGTANKRGKRIEARKRKTTWGKGKEGTLEYDKAGDDIKGTGGKGKPGGEGRKDKGE